MIAPKLVSILNTVFVIIGAWCLFSSNTFHFLGCFFLAEAALLPLELTYRCVYEMHRKAMQQ